VRATTNDELLDAVNTVIEERGLTGTTAELVAAAAGINRTTLYRKGFTRERLLAEAAAASSRDFEAAALAPLTAPGSAHDRMLLLLEALYDLADEHLGLLAGLYDGPSAIFHLGLDADDPTVLTRFEYTDPFERLLIDGDTDGTLMSDDPRTDAELIFNTAGWTYVHFRRSHGWAADTARPAVTRITLGAFLPVSQS
jgi:AcrR family transcriptional regulator